MDLLNIIEEIVPKNKKRVYFTNIIIYIKRINCCYKDLMADVKTLKVLKKHDNVDELSDDDTKKTNVNKTNNKKKVITFK